MELSPTQRIKYILALCSMLGLSYQANAVEKTQDIMLTLTTQEQTDPTNDTIKHYLDCFKKYIAVLREFAHDLKNNKKIGYYIKELKKLAKEVGDKAKHHNDAHHKNMGNIGKQIYQWHKDLHIFVKIIEDNETNPTAISTKLMQKPELKNLIPDEAEWTLANILIALNTRCRK